jgi:hypothetical protein
LDEFTLGLTNNIALGRSNSEVKPMLSRLTYG